MAGAMVVRVHDAKHPYPPVFAFDREAIERVGIRRQEALLKQKREAAEAAARRRSNDRRTVTRTMREAALVETNHVLLEPSSVELGFELFG